MTTAAALPTDAIADALLVPRGSYVLDQGLEPNPYAGLGPTNSWTERVEYKDGSVILFHRQRWPNGVMTERLERLPVETRAPPSTAPKAKAQTEFATGDLF